MEAVGGSAQAVAPREVGDVHQAVDAVLDAEEDAPLAHVPDLRGHLHAARVALAHRLPGVRLGRLHAELEALLLGVAADDRRLDVVADLDGVLRVLDPLPRHLGDVHQALEPGLHLDEGAVVGDADDAPGDAVVRLVALGSGGPRVGLDLLEAEADAAVVLVDLEHLHRDLVADVDHLGRVLDAPVREVVEVEQPVEAADVDERAEVGDPGDPADHVCALLEGVEDVDAGLESLGLRSLPRRIRQLDPGLARVGADHEELEGLADEVGAPVGPGREGARRHERLHADVDRVAAADLGEDTRGDRLALGRGGHEAAPQIQPRGLLARQARSRGRDPVDVDAHFVAHGRGLAEQFELAGGDGPAPDLGHLHGDQLAIDGGDRAGHHVTRVHGLRVEQRLKFVDRGGLEQRVVNLRCAHRGAPEGRRGGTRACTTAGHSD